MIRLGLFLAAFLLCAWYAFKAGGKPERSAITALGIALLITLSTEFWEGSLDFEALAWGWLVADSFLVVTLTVIALRANRLWPMVLAGLQLAAIFAHITKLLYPDLSPLGYAILLQIWSWPMLLTTFIGIHQHARRTQRGGWEADWKATTMSSTRQQV